jgi:hypothetical protein
MNAKLGKLTFKLHEQRDRLAPSTELRRKYLEASYHTQLRGEKAMIQSRIDRLTPGARRVFLMSRLEQLNQALR